MILLFCVYSDLKTIIMTAKPFTKKIPAGLVLFLADYQIVHPFAFLIEYGNLTGIPVYFGF